MCVDIPAYAEELASVLVQVRDVLAVVGQEAAVGEYLLEAVVEQAVFVEGENEPAERLVLGRDVFHLLVDVGNAAVVAEIFRDEVPVVCNWL